MTIRYVGRYRELRHGLPDGPSIHDREPLDPETKALVIGGWHLGVVSRRRTLCEALRLRAADRVRPDRVEQVSGEARPRRTHADRFGAP